MNWKDVLIGSISTLAVTVVGGVVIYYMTKEPELKTRELLTYSIRSSGDFSGDKERVAFTSIVISNRGGRSAGNVSAIIDFKSPSIKDLATDASPEVGEKRRVTPERAVLSYPRILPGEVVTVDLLLDSPARPDVTIRSDESLAVSDSSLGSNRDDRRIEINRASSLVVPISAILFSILGLAFLRRLKRIGSGSGMIGDRNNAAFLLLHSGLPEDADEILTASVRSGRYDSFTLSNLAICKAVQGDIAKANCLLTAAQHREVKGHAAAVLSFNEALLNLLSGRRAEGISCLRVALSISPSEIKRYSDRSVHLNAYRQDPDFIALTGGA
jgi:hypothetical protein